MTFRDILSLCTLSDGGFVVHKGIGCILVLICRCGRSPSCQRLARGRIKESILLVPQPKTCFVGVAMYAIYDVHCICYKVCKSVFFGQRVKTMSIHQTLAFTFKQRRGRVMVTFTRAGPTIHVVWFAFYKVIIAIKFG